MEKGKFEDSVNDAFRNAEVSPSEDSWTNIALELEKANGAQLKRRVFVYKMLAAASVIFIVGLGFGMYVINDRNADLANQLALLQKQNAEQLATNESARQSETISNGVASSQILDEDKIADENTTAQPRRNLSSGKDTQSLASAKESNNQEQLENLNVISTAPGVTETSAMLTSYSDADLPALYQPSNPQITARETNANVDPVVLMMARLNDREKEIQKKADEKKSPQREKLWTSVGLAAGSFSSSAPSIPSTPIPVGVSSGRTQTFSLSSNNVAEKEASADGIAYSVGVSLGASISSRWLLQGGVNYLTQSADYTIEAVVSDTDFKTFKPGSINEMANVADAPAKDEKIVTTAPYAVNKNMKYVSVPLQAGYLVINRAFAVQLNAGIATDLFLQSTVSADGGGLNTSTEESGSDSQYRTVNFSGLMGTEISYRFADHYRLALNPGIRYPLNSIYKSDIGIDATPITFDLGLRFRYIF
jgi:hypothetical protein